MKKKATLRARVTAYLGLYALLILSASAAATLWRGRAHAALKLSFENDLRALTYLSDLRVHLRGLHEGKPVRAEAEKVLSRLRTLQNGPVERELLSQLGADLSDKDMTEFRALKRLNLRELNDRRRRARRASVMTFFFTTACVFFSSWLLARMISKDILQPMAALVRRADGLENGGVSEDEGRESGIWEFDLLFGALDRAGVRMRLQYDKLKSLSAMRGRLVSMASHEYGNFMTAVVTGLGLLKDGVLPEDKRGKILEVVESNARMLARLGEDFLGLARADAGSISLEMGSVDLSRMARRFVELSSARSGARRVSVATEIEADLPEARGHAPTLSFVVNNLIGNALKYAREGGNVRVSLRSVPDGIEFSVKDDGIGMDAASVAKVLDGGYRSDEAKAAAPGFGVGLSLVQDVLEAHGSTLRIESAPGAGSAFSFTLTRMRAPSKEAALV